ncbi:MAG: phosphotransferase family protein [Candidatus Hodarchaeales archaeon]
MERELEQYLRKNYFQKDVFQFKTLDRITDGWETEVYSFSFLQNNISKELILRIYPGNDAKEKSAREFKVMDYLHKNNYPVPEVLYLESDDSILGKPFVIMEKINPLSMGSKFMNSDRKTQEKIISLFCQKLVELHNLDWKPFLKKDIKDPYYFINTKLGEFKNYIHRFQKYEFHPSLEWLSNKKSMVPCKKLSLTHNDYHFYNILLDKDDKPFIIDWGNADIADYRMDLAWTLLLMSTYGRAKVREQILTTYDDIAGLRTENIEYFEVMACIRRLFSILVSLGEGAEELGMRPGAEDQIKQDKGHIENVYKLFQKYTRLELSGVENLLKNL